MRNDAGAIVLLRQALLRRARWLHGVPLELSLGAGVHALVGTPADGTLDIARLVGGFDPTRSGQVLVAGRDPREDPVVRARIGVTLDVPRLPIAKRVGQLLHEVDALRGTPSATGALGALGLAHWAERKLGSLSPWEVRALDLAIAMSTSDPVALVLTEPGADMAPFDRQALRESLARAGETATGHAGRI